VGLSDLWNSALLRLSSKIAPHNFELWLRPIECLSLDDDLIRLRAPNNYVKLWFESNFLGHVLDELRTCDGRTRLVEFEVVEEAMIQVPLAPPPSPSPMLPPARSAPAPLSSGLAAVSSEAVAVAPAPPATGAVEPAPPQHWPGIAGSGLNAKYNFDSFVAGPSNQLAHAAARAVASPEPPKYNPLFICGGVGLGKTHLLHAIGLEILRIRPQSRVIYLSGERFMNDYILCIRNNRMADFRRRYRDDCDVLLLDDIQFFANKDGTQDEFFHTFNALYEQQKHIVLSADRKPHEIPDIADRLRSRFAWGLMADIEPPELEVRIAILKKKAASEHVPLPDDVALYIAQAIKSNVRELEGAFIRLVAYASLNTAKTITLEFAQATLEGALNRQSDQITVDQVLKAVASYYQVKISELKSERRHKSIAGPRAVAMYLARKLTGSSYPDLGRAFGGKHHTTIISAVEKTTERIKGDGALRGEVAAIEASITR
jgi:chromosomal replication initiator protein